MPSVFKKIILPSIIILAVLNSGFLRAQEAPPAKTAPPQAQKPAEFYFGFLEYRYALHNRVIARWQELVRANRSKLVPTRLTLKYYVNSSGFISVIESASKNSYSKNGSNEQKLAEYALALENEAPFAFPEPIKKEFPFGFFYQISLSVR